MGFRDYIKVDINKDGLKKSMEKAFGRVFAKAAGMIRDELTMEAKKAIEAFYNDYSPMYYSRHYNFYGSYAKYYSNSHGNIFKGGVRLLPSAIPNDYGKYVTGAEVFDLVYSGFHGPPIGHNIGTPRMSPTPNEIILRKQEEIIANIGKYIGGAASGVHIK